MGTSSLTLWYLGAQAWSMAKKKEQASTGRTGRPPKPDKMTERSLVRYTEQDLEKFSAEAERLTRLTGQQWTVSGYLRVAGLAYLGKHLAGGA